MFPTKIAMRRHKMYTSQTHTHTHPNHHRFMVYHLITSPMISPQKASAYNVRKALSQINHMLMVPPIGMAYLDIYWGWWIPLLYYPCEFHLSPVISQYHSIKPPFLICAYPPCQPPWCPRGCKLLQGKFSWRRQRLKPSR